MPDASFIQTNFLGGEWSPFAQGRADIEAYRTACNVMYNYVALEVGAATRRSGTNVGGTTRDGVNAVLRAFHFSEALPFDAELTAGHMRLWNGLALLLENTRTVATISTATPAVVQTGTDHGLTTGDQVQFGMTQMHSGVSPSGMKLLFNRQFVATVTDTTHFSLTDPVTGASIDGSQINGSGWDITVSRVVDFSTSYLDSELAALRLVQNEEKALILHPSHKPEVLTNTTVPTASQLAVFSFGTATFLDGPYLDPPTDGSTLQASATSGTITLTASAITSINGGAGFASTDVGRMVRLFSEPSAWASGTAYSKGDNVTYGNVQWQAIAASTGVQPDTDPGLNWVINPSGALWTWGAIASVVSTSQITLTLAAADPLGVLAGGPLLYSGASHLIKQWQLGLYSDTTDYPGVGCFHEGRFWLGGVTANRLDSTQANSTDFNFGPTLLDGSVPDNCGISVVFEGEDRNTIFWALPDHQGVIIGTQGGEWLMQASQLNEPLTPTSIQAHKVTKYGCANIEPRSTGLSHVFVHRYGLQLYEYITDVFSGKFIGTNIGRKAKHMISPGIAEIAYQAEKAPIVWSRTTDNRLIGCTYKRESPFSTQPASYMGWHKHVLGSGREVTSIQGGPAPGGATDSLAMVTHDTSTGIHYVELLADLPEETDTLFSAWFADGAAVPAAAEISGGNLILYGLQYIIGKTVMAWIAGTDAGDFVVASDGTVTIPLPANLLTSAYLASLTGSYSNLNLAIQVSPAGKGFFSPIGAALDYVSSSSSPAHYAQIAQTAVFDWDANRLYSQQGQKVGDPGTNGHSLFVFNIATQAQVSGPLDPGELAFAAATCLGYDGHVYYVTGDATHLVGRFNVTSGTNDLNYDDTHSLAAPGFCVAINGPDGQYVLATGLDAGGGGGSSAPWWIVNMTGVGGPAYTGATGFFDEQITSLGPGNAYPCRGPDRCAYVVAINDGGTVIGLYKAAVDGPLLAGVGKVGTFAPADVDATWTSFSFTTTPGIIYDETDGNVIVCLTGSDTTHRIVKISSRDASVLWQVQVTGGNDFRMSRIRFGRLSYLDGAGAPYTMKEIDTIAGTITSGATSSAIAPGAFATDDIVGQVVINVNDIGTTNWATFGPAANSGLANITPATVYNAPAVIGFDYDSDLQILRPVNAQEAGAANGPAQGKTRRVFRAAPYFANAVGTNGAVGVRMGTYFTKLRSCIFKSPGGTVALTAQQLYTGIYRDTVDDDYSYDGMWCCRTNRGYPTTVVSVECFLHTQDL